MTYRRFLYVAIGFVGLLGLALRVQALALLALGGAALLLTAWREARRGLAGLTLRRDLYPSAFEDDEVPVSLALENHSRRTSWLVEIGDSFGPAVAERQALLEPGPLHGARRRRLTYRTLCSRSWGIHAVGPLRLATSDPFGLFHAERSEPEVAPFAVFPRVWSVAGLEKLGARPSLSPQEITSARPGQSLAYFGVRDYRPGDDLRRIHWPATARRGSPAIKEHEVDLVPYFTLFLDLDRAHRAGTGLKSTLEYLVRTSACLVWTAARRGDLVQVLGEGNRSLVVPPGAGTLHATHALYELIRAQQDGRPATRTPRASVAPAAERGGGCRSGPGRLGGDEPADAVLRARPGGAAAGHPHHSVHARCGLARRRTAMRTMGRAKAGAGLAALVAVAAGQATSDDVPVRPKATLEFRVVATWAGGETHPIGSFGTGPLEGAESATASMQVKPVEGGGGSPCRNSNVVMAPGPAKTPDGPLPLWQVEGKVRRAEMDDIQVEYAWKRWSEAGVESSPDASSRGEAHLSEGGRMLLDFVPVFEASSGCWHNVALELSASIPEDPPFKDRRIGYDVWLVSEGHGSRLTRRLQLIGKQGEKIAFDYGVFRSKLPVAPRPDVGTAVVEMTVTGSIRSRIQPDGSIEILLAAERGAHPSDGHWFGGAYGSKRVRATPGETLRLELPPPAPVAGVDEPDTFKALAEQRVALILTPTLME